MQRVSPERRGMSNERLSRIESVVSEYIERGEVAGAVTAIARAGDLVHLGAFGRRDIGADSPMREGTIFRIFSMTKPITSVAVLILFEEGKLRLSDPVSRFFPEFGAMRVYAGGEKPPFSTVEAEREITIWDLLTHAAGLAYGIGDPHPAEQAFGEAVWEQLAADPGLGLEYFAEVVAEQPLVQQPGKGWRYSASVDLLAAIVERAAGQSFAEFLQKRIFEPLEMVDTSFTVPQRSRDRLAVLYQLQEDGSLKEVQDRRLMAFVRPNSHPNGGGGLVSSAADYLRFAQMLLGRGEYEGTRILGQRTVDLMTMNHLPSGIWVQESSGRGFGLGVEVVVDPSQERTYATVGQFGWGGAATTRFWVDPREQLIILVLVQLFPGFCRPVVDDVRVAAYQAIIGGPEG